MEVSDFDECECGDFRLDHVNLTGRCTLPDTLVHGFKPCKRFRYFRPSTWSEIEHQLRVRHATLAIHGKGEKWK